MLQNENLYADVIKHAQKIADALGTIEGVRAVVLGGSWARGAGTATSDIDLGIFYDPEQPPSIAALRDLAAQLDDSHNGEAVTNFGEWGPWINGGGWLRIGGKPVDWLYRDLQLVKDVINDCVDGKPKLFYQPGHPHGFHTPIYLGEAAVCQPLYDPFEDIAALKVYAVPYPPLLKRALIQSSLWEAGFALDTSRKSVTRGDVFHVSGGFFRCVACLVQVLFALNERYWINEKGSIQAISGFALRPADFEAVVHDVLGNLGTDADALKLSLARLETLVSAVRAMCEKEEG